MLFIMIKLMFAY